MATTATPTAAASLLDGVEHAGGQADLVVGYAGQNDVEERREDQPMPSPQTSRAGTSRQALVPAPSRLVLARTSRPMVMTARPACRTPQLGDEWTGSDRCAGDAERQRREGQTGPQRGETEPELGEQGHHEQQAAGGGEERQGHHDAGDVGGIAQQGRGDQVVTIAPPLKAREAGGANQPDDEQDERPGRPAKVTALDEWVDHG